MQNSQSMRAAITGKFKDKMNGTDVHTVNRLIIMGRMELEETLMLWKGASHVSETAYEATPSPCARSFPSCNAQSGAYLCQPVALCRLRTGSTMPSRLRRRRRRPRRASSPTSSLASKQPDSTRSIRGAIVFCKLNGVARTLQKSDCVERNLYFECVEREARCRRTWRFNRKNQNDPIRGPDDDEAAPPLREVQDRP